MQEKIAINKGWAVNHGEKRLKIKYRDRVVSADRTECRDYNRTIWAYSAWQVGGLLYCRVNQFEVKALEIDLIDAIEEV